MPGSSVPVADASAIDYETLTSYSLTVEASDGTTPVSETVNINVSDVNENTVGAISDSDASADSVAENSIIGTTVGITAFADDPDGLATLEESSAALHRFAPALADVGIRTYVAGFSTYTPDGLPVFGAAPGIDGLLFAGGCSGAGIAISGGVGEAIAALALGQRPEIDIDAFRLDRFGAVDPFDPAFRARCAAARSKKREG